MRHPLRRKAHRLVPRSQDAGRLATEFVRQCGAEWGVPELVHDAILIAAELVGNAVRHTASIPELRLDLRRGMLTVAVLDDDPNPAVMIEHPGPWQGLGIVDRAARVWGSSHRWSGGKVVWAVLTLDREILRLAPGRSTKDTVNGR